MGTDGGIRNITVSVGLLGAVLLFVVAFGGSLGSGFVYDDHLLIVDNPYAHDFGHLGRAFSTHFWDLVGHDDRAQRYYRPLVTLSYIVDWKLGGGRAWSFHLVNVLLHGLSVLLAASWARRLLRTPLWFVPVVLFALHPSRAESVYWISGRTDLLAAFFLLLSLEAVHRARAGRRGWWALAAVSALCALLCKELAVVLPLLLLAERAREHSRAHGLAAIGAGVLSAGYLLARALLMPPFAHEAGVSPKLGLLTVEGFFERLLWPWPQTMFARTGLAMQTTSWFELALGGLLVVLSTVLLFVAWRRERSAFWLLASAWVTLLPVSNLIPSGLPVLASDRFLYLPLLLAALGGTLLCARPLGRWAAGARIEWPSAGVATLMCGVLVLRLPPFEDNESFWNHELALDPCNPPGLEYRASQAARLGDLSTADQLTELMLNAPCVAKTRVHTTLYAKARVRHLTLKAALTADGDVVRLERLLSEMSSEHSRNPHHPELVAELAGVAARLGHDRVALEHTEQLEGGDLAELPAPANLVLTLARLGLHQRARTLLGRLQDHEPQPLIDEATAAHLVERVNRADIFAEKSRKNSSERPKLLALAQAELGAYLRALRILALARPRPTEKATTALLVQLLVLARLEDQALSVLAQQTSKANARAVLNDMLRRMPRDVLALGPVPPERGPRFLLAR